MKKSKIKILSTLIISCYILLITISVANAALVPCGCMSRDAVGNCTNEVRCTVCHLFVGIHNIMELLLFGIATPLAVLVILYGGFMLLTSAGSEEKVRKGKNAIWMAIMGIIIAFAGWLIVDTILRALVNPNVMGQFWRPFPSCS
ncbi:MAG: pilin [Patescibacteria group bacterium]